jgi:hypothetical protein
MDTVPTNADKEFIYTNINKLSQSDHMHIYTILEDINENICNISNLYVTFNIDDVPTFQFWKIYEFVKLSIENLTRTKLTSAF